MNELLLDVTRFAMLTFLLASMLQLGLSLTFSQVLEPLRNARLVVLALVANFVAVPLLAVGITKIMRLEQPFAVGLLLMALAPGAPFIPKVVQLARGNLPFGTGLMVMLMGGTVVCVPLALPRILTGVEVSPWKIAQPLLFLMLLPLLAGLVVHARFPSLPSWLCLSLNLVSNAAGLLLVVLIVALNFRSVLSLFGTGAIFAGIVFVVLSALIGWLFGTPDRANQITLGMGTGSRNFAAALLVGAQNFKDPRVSVIVIASAIAALATLLPLAAVLSRRAESPGVDPGLTQGEA